MSTEDPETRRLRKKATEYRSQCIELEGLFTQYVGKSIKRLLQTRSAKPHEFQAIDDRLSLAKKRCDLMEVFVKNDVNHHNSMNYEEFKNAMLLLGFMSEEETIFRTFKGLDQNSDAQIDERELIRGVLGKKFRDEFSFKQLIETLNSEIKNVELKAAEDGDEIEQLLLENEKMRGDSTDPEEVARLKQMVNDMTGIHSDLTAKLKGELETDVKRLREYGMDVRNQLNLLQRETIVSCRTSARKVLEMGGANEQELRDYDKETERSQRISQSRQVFINLDDDHTGKLNVEKFIQAYQWLNINATVPALRQKFKQLDTEGSGLLSEEDFVKSVAEGLEVSEWSPKAQHDEVMQRLSDFDDHISAVFGSDVSQKLRERLENMKREMNNNVGKLFSTMGLDPAQFLSPEVLEKHLGDAFDKFDTSRDGRLGFNEFQKAWHDLNLKGSSDDIRSSFEVVDADHSGLIDKMEFVTAIKESRLPELNMNIILDKLGVKIASMQDRYAAFNSTYERRRKQRKTMEATLSERLGELCGVLCEITGKPRDTQKAQVAKELLETFERFDRNGSGELNLEEYKKAWKFLGKPGTDEEIKKAFVGVDVDGSGLIEYQEFVFSIQGEDALKYGLIADLELMLQLCTEVAQDLKDIRSERSDVQKALYSTQDRLRNLQREVTTRTETLIQQMKSLSADSKGITYGDIDNAIRDAYSKADSTKSGTLNIWQFTQAWMSLGLGGNEDGLRDLYQTAERFGGNGVDVRQFIRIVKQERSEELNVRQTLSTLEYLFGKSSTGDATATRRRLARQKIDGECVNILSQLVDNVLPCTDDALSNSYLAKREHFNKLRAAFEKFDTPKTGVLGLQQYKDARRQVGYSGSDADLEKAFKSVDVDNSGAVDVFEFVFSDMGKKGSKVGCLGYVKILNKLLSSAIDRLQGGGPIQSPTSPEDSNKRNAIRLNARKMVQRMTGFGGVDAGKLEKLGIKVDRRANSITAGMLEHILHD